MWVFLSNSMLSIVAPDPKRLTAEQVAADVLVVRARAKGDIEAVFPDAEVATSPDRDYRFRAILPREQVAEVMARQVLNITATNFKDSVKQQDRHDAYLAVWSAMHRFQGQRVNPASARRTGGDPFGDMFGLTDYWATQGYRPAPKGKAKGKRK